MGGLLVTFLAILASVLAVTVAALVVIYLVVPLFKGIGWLIRHVFGFIFGVVGDALRCVGALVTQVFLIPLVLGNIVIGRWSAAAHYGRAIQAELGAAGRCLYRVLLGHPARLVGLGPALEGVEKRLPEVVAAAPGADRPGRRVGQFEGYTIVGSLPGGGSGSRLYVAEPDDLKRAAFERQGHSAVEQVVIKVFSVHDGSSLPQIVRESRALDAARKLGLVLEHELTDERFFYVTRYVPGESLGLVTQRLHAASGPEGLGRAQLREALGYAGDLLETLCLYHRGGLWHKDVKPDNIIVGGGRAHLVDFGLVTPLRSAMTLTTHGTEYFRDPELVRLALKGVKVHQVDGAKFDIYAAGAVLFSMIENSFPAHGGLSQITRRCPEALRWVVRRAMTDYDKRYASAQDMLADVRAILQAPDPFALKPVVLPSMRGTPAPEPLPEEDEPILRRHVEAVAIGAGSDAPADEPFAPGAHAGPAPAPRPSERKRPNIRIKDWWTGRYIVDGEAPDGPPGPGVFKVMPGVYVAGCVESVLEAVGVRQPRPRGAAGSPVPPRTPRPAVRFRPPSGPRRPAREQLARARERAHAARTRAQERIRRRRSGAGNYASGINGGVAVALTVLLLLVGLVIAGMIHGLSRGRTSFLVINEGGPEPTTVLASNGDVPLLVEPRAVAVAPAASASTDADVLDSLALAGLEPGQRLLVVGENLTGLTDEASAAVAAALSRLSEAGFTLIGNFPGNPAAGEALEAQTDLAAAASRVKGLAPLDAPDTAAALGDWLAAEGGADLLCWLTAERTRNGVRPRYFLFGPRVHENEDPDAIGRARALLELATHAVQGGAR